MRKQVYILISLLLTAVQVFAQPLKSFDTAVYVNIDAGVQGQPISRLVYGQFIELLFNYFEGGLWAEMLGDRKFFYPVNSAEKQYPANSRSYLGRWKPVGEDAFIITDSANAYTAEHAVKVQLQPDVKHGIQQPGLVLQKGREYTVYAILKGVPGTTINISLGNTSAEIKISGEGYNKYPLKFSPLADMQNGVFEVSATGNGAFYIGAVSLMPADNVEGFRKDILRDLKNMNLGMLRWGGNASSGYNWRNGIGDRDKRPPVYDYAWGAMESNDVGTHEYLTLCQLLNVEPYIGVNAGFGDAQSAAQWVEYVNGPARSPMGNRRADNGHAEPYKVKWWGIGNEMYGEWQLGRMQVKHYVIKHKMFAVEMREVDPSIIIVGSGATPFETGSTSVYSHYPAIAKVPYAYGSEQDWSGQMLAHASGYMDYIAEHLYPISDSAYNENLQRFEKMNDDVPARIRRLPNRIKGAAEAFSQYLTTIPSVKQNNIFIALDEWRMKDGWGLEDALATAEAFNEIARHTDVFKMSAYTSTNAPLALMYNTTASAIQPNGLTIKLYADHFGAIPVSVSGNTPQPQIAGTTGADRPAETSGSSTYPLDVMAALTTDRKNLTIAVVNPTGKPQKININYNNISLSGTGKKWTIAGTNLKAVNKPGEKPEITIIPSDVRNAGKGLTVDAYSVSLFELKTI